ncbi:hypothetical protein ACFX13_000296 [Malus domestica]
MRIESEKARVSLVLLFCGVVRVRADEEESSKSTANSVDSAPNFLLDQHSTKTYPHIEEDQGEGKSEVELHYSGAVRSL